MKLFTSDFKTSGTNPRAIAVCRHVPDTFHGKHIPDLAPPQHLDFVDDEQEFRSAYRHFVLNCFDPGVLISMLGDGAVLLCHCVPGRRCHRRYIAEWLSIYNNIEISEI